MKKPEGWYAFKVNCPLYDIGFSNMSPESAQQYCERGKNKYGDRKKCIWTVCPRLKRLRKAINDNIEPVRPDLYKDGLYKKEHDLIDPPPKEES